MKHWDCTLQNKLDSGNFTKTNKRNVLDWTKDMTTECYS